MLSTALDDHARQAARSKVKFFSYRACLINPLSDTARYEDLQERAIALAQEAKEQGVTVLNDLIDPLLGIVREVKNQKGATVDYRVLLLSGDVAIRAAHLLDGSLPIYPLEPEGVDALIAEGIFDEEQCLIKDRDAALDVLLKLNLGISAELFADPTDPIIRP